MSSKCIFSYVLCLSLLFTSGCWDRKELSDLALWLATGWDVGEEDNIQVTGQIIIPSSMQSQNGGGNKGKEFFTVSAKGGNLQDTMQNLQVKLSRQAFFGQRRVVYFGEEFAKLGLKDKLDANTRQHDVSIRTDIFVVKGGTGKEVLNLSYPLEKPPAVAAFKEHRELGGRGDTAFLHFLIAANSEGIRPTIPAVEIGKSQNGENENKEDPSASIVRIAGVAIFDHELKMVGYLNNQENKDLLWILGILKNLTVTAPIKDGNTSILLKRLDSKIIPKITKNNQIKFTVELTGKGDLLENNTVLDPTKPEDLKLIENKLEKVAKNQVLQTIKKVQKEYGLDIFGFGEVIHKKKPQQWNSLKTNWDNTFAEADISVKVNLKIKQIGFTRSTLLKKESEIIK